MTKKVIVGRENGKFFPKKNVIQKYWSAKNVSVPPNSAPGLRHWEQYKSNVGDLALELKHMKRMIEP